MNLPLRLFVLILFGVSKGFLVLAFEEPVCNTTFPPTVRLPAEWEPHLRTFMVWPASKEIWDKGQLEPVREDIARIAKAIADFEPVVILVRPEQMEAANKTMNHSNVKMVPIDVDDLWARDTAPVFIEAGGKVIGVNFHFNGWGNKPKYEQEFSEDQFVARRIMGTYGIPCLNSSLVGEGGSFETDGEGTLLVTESSLVNDNRNPGKTRDTVETELKNMLGVKKVIWFKGVKGQDITDAHVDALVRFAAPGTVIINRPFPGTPAEESDLWAISSDDALKVLNGTTDAKGRALKIVELVEPDREKIKGKGDEFLASYVNYYVANGAVIFPVFGDKDADEKAQNVLKKAYPGRTIVGVEINALAAGGGGIHCATHDQPASGSQGIHVGLKGGATSLILACLLILYLDDGNRNRV